MSEEMYCHWCDDDEPQLLDIDGVRGDVSGSKVVCWAHAYEDDWWPCQRKAAEEHAEVERLQAVLRAARTALDTCRRGMDPLGRRTFTIFQ